MKTWWKTLTPLDQVGAVLFAMALVGLGALLTGTAAGYLVAAFVTLAIVFIVAGL